MSHQFVLSLAVAVSLLLPAALIVEAKFQCLDSDGSPLDWFALLKQPDTGEFAYVSSSSPRAWTQPAGSDLTRNGPVFATVSQTLAGSKSVASADVLAAYNDEPPAKDAARRVSSSSFGHMKGLVALTAGQRGFWLIHSVPKFPNISLSHYEYPHTGMKYGQSFLCLTVDSSAMAEAIGKQLFASHPDLYSLSVKSSIEAAWPSWAELKRHKSPPASLMNSTVWLNTSGGLSVMHLAKSPHLHQDLYSYLLANQLDSNIQVETWQHGGSLLNSSCSKRYNVTKVLRVRIGDKQLAEFRSTSDHSKWCVTAGAKSEPHVCIGDMNRAETQFHRGGGIACVGLAGLHGLFKAAVLGDQSCGSVDPGNKRDKLDRELLRSLYTWVIVAVICAVACTLLSVVYSSSILMLWMALTRVKRRQQRMIGDSGRYRIL